MSPLMIMVVKNKKGQALFEFLIFLPFTFIMVTVFINVGNSINGAINQQKIARGYLFYELKGNSMFPRASTLLRWKEDSSPPIVRVSSYMIGWKNASDASGRYPISPCYRTNKLLIPADGPETCEIPNLPTPTDPSAFIRIYTVYGVCSTPYFYDATEIRPDPESYSNCSLGNN